jgi:hypothetical protein
MIHNLFNLSNVFSESQKGSFVLNFNSTEIRTKNLNVDINKSVSMSQNTTNQPHWNKDSTFFKFLQNEFSELKEISSIIKSDQYIIEYK